MKYYSTRDKNVSLSAAKAVKMGLSRDGGLLTPTRIPQIDRAFLERLIPMEYAQRAAKVMALYLTDYSEEELLTFGRNAYGPAQFDDPIAAPVRKVENGLYCLELWHGPTSAFKDMALQMLPQLLSAALRKTGEKRTACILAATSGDTGKAAMAGFADVPQTCIQVYYPKDGVSPVQERQMVTQEGESSATLITHKPALSVSSPMKLSGRSWTSGVISCPLPTPSTGAVSCPKWSTTSPPTAIWCGTALSPWGTR